EQRVRRRRASIQTQSAPCFALSLRNLTSIEERERVEVCNLDRIRLFARQLCESVEGFVPAFQLDEGQPQILLRAVKRRVKTHRFTEAVNCSSQIPAIRSKQSVRVNDARV